jgi:hypothetical protein
VTGLSRKRSRLAELWPADQRHLAAARIAEWFATYVHLPKPHDRVVSETGSATRSPGSIRNSRMQRGPTKPPIYRAPLAKGPRTGRCRKPPCWCGRRLRRRGYAPLRRRPTETNPTQLDEGGGPVSPIARGPTANQQPRRFFWICRDRHGSAGEGVRGHFERSWPIVGAYSALTRVSAPLKRALQGVD